MRHICKGGKVDFNNKKMEASVTPIYEAETGGLRTKSLRTASAHRDVVGIRRNNISFKHSVSAFKELTIQE